jgi:tRNA 5-methylaminomethyl-2-thiouridine biosynthesis bifunctional protein
MAGAAVALSLAQRGWQVDVLEAAPALGAGASGLPVGLAAPHVSPDDHVLSRITRAGVQATLERAHALTQAGALSAQDWGLSGVLEQRIKGPREGLSGKRLPQAHEHWGTLASDAQLAAAGLPCGSPALWHSQAAWLRPRPWVTAQLAAPGIRLRLGCAVQRISHSAAGWAVWNQQGELLSQTPALVLASAFDTAALLQALANQAPGALRPLPLHALRGQISFGRVDALPVSAQAQLPPFPVNGHGSFISGVAAPNSEAAHWFMGSTFERDCYSALLRPEDHLANQARLNSLLPALAPAMAQGFEADQVQGWAGVRCTLPDRLPAVGQIDPAQWPGLHVCTGMGARGISLAVLCGEVLAASLDKEPLPLPPELAKHLAAHRFAPIRIQPVS